MMYVRVTSAFAASTLLTLLSYAQAQSIPPQGELHVTFTATSVPPVKPMDIGDGKQYLQVNLIMSASNDQGNPILNNMGGRCQLTRLMEGGKPIEQNGYCTYSDADNDLIFERCNVVPGQALPAGATNMCELTGGTGKFQGLQASVAITSIQSRAPTKGLSKSSATRTARIKS
jgi:hypothetical protein